MFKKTYLIGFIKYESNINYTQMTLIMFILNMKG